MKIVFQRSRVDPTRVVPICKVTSPVAEHVVILPNGESKNLISYVRRDGGVDHPLLESALVKRYCASSHQQIPQNVTQTTPPSRFVQRPQMLVTPLRSSQNRSSLDKSSIAAICLCKVMTLYEDTKDFLRVYNVNTGFEEFPEVQHFPTLLLNVLRCGGNALDLPSTTSQQKQQADFLALLVNFGTDGTLASIVCNEYPNMIVNDQLNDTAVIVHPTLSQYQDELHMASRHNLSDEFNAFISGTFENEFGSVDATTPRADRNIQSMEEIAAELAHMMLLHVMMKYLKACKASVHAMNTNHNCVALNLSFVTVYWMKAMTNVRTGNATTLNIAGYPAPLVNGILEFLKIHGDPKRDTKAPYVLLQGSPGSKTVGWIVHPTVN